MKNVMMPNHSLTLNTIHSRRQLCSCKWQNPWQSYVNSASKNDQSIVSTNFGIFVINSRQTKFRFLSSLVLLETQAQSCKAEHGDAMAGQGRVVSASHLGRAWFRGYGAVLGMSMQVVLVLLLLLWQQPDQYHGNKRKRVEWIVLLSIGHSTPNYS